MVFRRWYKFRLLTKIDDILCRIAMTTSGRGHRAVGGVDGNEAGHPLGPAPHEGRGEPQQNPAEVEKETVARALHGGEDVEP